MEEISNLFLYSSSQFLLALNDLRLYLNHVCKNLEAWQIIAYTVAVTIIITWILDFLIQDESLYKRTKKWFFKNMKKLPPVKRMIDKELSKTTNDLNSTFAKGSKGMPYIVQLPKKGFTKSEVLAEVAKYKALNKVDFKGGACSGTMYNGADDLTELNTQVYGEFAWTNPLHPDVFPDVRKMEAEVVRMTCTLFNGDDESCGTMTSGGTESIMLACLAYRNRANDRGIRKPEMILPITAHAAFDKSASAFNIRTRHIEVDKVTRKVKLSLVKRAINKNTCVIVGSAPHFGHGIMDDIEELAKIGLKYKIPVHVDSCLGGFLLPFMKKAGFPVPKFDFSVAGVTSISADTHKYGYAPKGSSVIMYCNAEYRTFQYFVQPDWPGGIYATPTFAGSRAGAIIAACWATMVYMGEDGYVESTKKIIQTREKIEKALRKIPSLFVYGEPQASVVAVGSNEFNVYRLSDAMSKKGWNLNATQFPSSVHLCCTMTHTREGVVERFIKDVNDCVNDIMQDPKAKCSGQGAVYGLAQSIPDRKLVAEIVNKFFDAYYNTDAPNSSQFSNGSARSEFSDDDM